MTVALVLPLPDPNAPEQHEKCCVLCKKRPDGKSSITTNSLQSLKCRLTHYYPKQQKAADCILLNQKIDNN
jgi:hypothetical protein